MRFVRLARIAVASVMTVGVVPTLNAQMNGRELQYREPSLWPISAHVLAWPGATIGMLGSGVALEVNPASVVVAERNYTEVGRVVGWNLSNISSVTHVASGLGGAVGVQACIAQEQYPLRYPLLPHRAYWVNLSLGSAVGLASGFGAGVSVLSDRTTGETSVRVSGGAITNVGPISVGASLLNARSFTRDGETAKPDRVVLAGAGLRLTPWLMLAGDARAILRWKPRPGSEKPWSFLTRRLMWFPEGRFSAGLILQPWHFLQLAARYDFQGRLMAGGLEIQLGPFGALLAVGKLTEEQPLVSDVTGSMHSRNRLLWVASISHHFGLTRRAKMAIANVRRARELMKQRKLDGAREALERALALQPNDSSAIRTWKILAEVDSLMQEKEKAVGNKESIEQRRPKLTAEQVSTSLKTLDSLRNAYARKIQQNPPQVDKETANWHAPARNLGPAVNSIWDDFSPSVTVDGQRLFFTSDRLGSVGTVRELDGTVHGSEDFWMSTKMGGAWSQARNLGQPINTEGSEGAPCISAGGQRIFFVKCSMTEGFGHCDIYVADLHGDKWTSPRNLGPAINTPFWEAHPSISADGKSLYFAREDTTGINIWYSTLSDTGWTKARKLGPEVNSPFDEVSPFIHADGKTLYFASNRPGGYGGYDLYVSRWVGSRWSEARNLGPWINTKGDEKYFSVPGAGDKAFFASSKSGGLGRLDIYEIELPPSMRPNPITTVKGRVLNALTGKPVEAEIYLRSLDTGEEVAVTRSNATSGEYLVVLPSAHIYSVLARATGYVDYTERYEIKIQDAYREVNKDFFIHPARIVRRIHRRIVDPETGEPILAELQIKRLSDGEIIGQAYTDVNGEVTVDVPADGDYGLFYQAPGYTPFSEQLAAGTAESDTVVTVSLQKVTPEKEIVFPVNLIFFDFNSAHLRKESTAELLQAVEFLKKYPDLKVEIQGHTDDIGPAEYNLDLSQRRAEAVRQFLIERGIPGSRLVARGYGETKPKVPNTSEENRAKNRRVEFKILSSKSAETNSETQDDQ